MCGPYTDIQLGTLSNELNALPGDLYLCLVDWEDDCRLCGGDNENTDSWTTRVMVDHLHINAIQEGIACGLVRVMDDADGT